MILHYAGCKMHHIDAIRSLLAHRVQHADVSQMSVRRQWPGGRRQPR